MDIVAIFIPIISIIMVFSIPIAAIITEHLQKNKKADVIQKAIEAGVPIENLKFDAPKTRLPYRSGMVTLAVGVGISLIAWLNGDTMEEGGGFMLGAGVLVALIGLALLINDRMNYEKFFKRDE